MRGAAWRLAGATLGLFALAACSLEPDMGFVEIKTVPVTAAAPLPLYLDSGRLDPLRKGNAVLRQRVGTAKLQIEGSTGQLALICDLVVKKNRITTVTISVLERPPRCQCRNNAGSDRASSRICIS
jgi:hypothetical protein